MPSVHFSSATDSWATPQDFFDRLNSEFHFTLDVCADDENHKCGKYFTKEMDGLSQPWTGVCWCNPPYGRQMPKWVRKASDSASQGATVVCLIPARTDTKYWHHYIWDRGNRPRANVEVRLVEGRLKFGGGKNSAPFPSAVIVFRPAPIRGVTGRVTIFTETVIPAGFSVTGGGKSSSATKRVE
jgi:phage N-6-adenine-methyltransferase